MIFHIITLFPNALKGYFDSSILGRAQKSKKIKIKFYDLRKFGIGKHKMVDDKPFGGGAGMVLKIEPILKAVETALRKHKTQITRLPSPAGSANGGQAKTKQIPNSKFQKVKQKNKIKIILLSPAGKQFTQKMAIDWANKRDDIIFISGHYEGIDTRVKKAVKDLTGSRVEEISIGPYVLTGGELGAGVIVDAVSRHIPGVLGKSESLEDKKGIGIPVYTRPEVFLAPLSGGGKNKGYKTPKVLLSGHHKNIETWRAKHAK
jgi:tRNA (guanine37-N1)-methyltransferase